MKLMDTVKNNCSFLLLLPKYPATSTSILWSMGGGSTESVEPCNSRNTPGHRKKGAFQIVNVICMHHQSSFFRNS